MNALTLEDVIADSEGDLETPLDVEFADDLEGVRTWVSLLAAEVSDVHHQLTVSKADHAVNKISDSAFHKARRRAAKRQHKLEQRLRVAKHMRRQLERKADPSLDRVNLFANAIREHRRACRAAGEPSDFDTVLWSTLRKAGFER